MIIVLTVPSALAFDGHIVTEGPLRVEIAPVTELGEYERPYKMKVVLNNSSADPLRVLVQMNGLVDEWYAVGSADRKIEIDGNGVAEVIFRIAAGRGACSALYPVHVLADFMYDGQAHEAHAVRIFKTKFPKENMGPGRILPVNVLPLHGAVNLARLESQRVAWQYFDQPINYMPVGWAGSADPARASFAIRPVTRQSAKIALDMHPAWYQGSGTIFAEYRLKLPAIRPITFSFANAIRDHMPPEPASDGVTFGVWVDTERIFSRHTDSKVWIENKIDLSAYSGKTILLRLESHPGPKRNTTCDSSYWGEPVISTGKLPQEITEKQRQALRARARAIVKTGVEPSTNGVSFNLQDGYKAAFVYGRRGLVHTAIALGKGDDCVVFDGLDISLLGNRLGEAALQPLTQDIAITENTKYDDVSTGSRYVIENDFGISQRFQLDGEACTLEYKISQQGAGLKVKVSCAQRITDIAPGRFDQQAKRVYYGHGYVIEAPQAFRASFGGHDLSTSHVGFDFENGMSLLVASDSPPDYLQVNPDTHQYALHTHMNSTLTFVPGNRGAFDCARKYRPLYDKKASPGFEKKAGRFVFDIWGGNYADNARIMQRMIDYGLTDSLLTLHVWQRWGYDYRLPDIYPPNPALGTIKDMQKLGRICDAAGIPWGLHDNYIDFYPDAQDYSYDHICFTEGGEPIKAWLNAGREAQSYRWRPDRIMPFIERNLKLIGPTLNPTHYFIDVFTSIPCIDFYDRAGTFHSSLETRRHWGQAFRWIQDYLGGAVTTSEAGHDQLVGDLDGADCQHLNISAEPRRFNIHIKCKDWQRVPWFDAVLHDKFSLHGVGYPGRYEGGRATRFHGVDSDDYISAEMLTGHALMISRNGFGQGAIRKYWLGQDFIRSIATASIAHVQFVDSNIHRQFITWDNGAVVYVNRGVADWSVRGRILPKYGFLAMNGQITASIERINGVIAESSTNSGDNTYYVNARGFNPENRLAICPCADKIEYIGARKFKLPVLWDAQGPAPKDYAMFVHFKTDRSERYDRIAFQADANPTVPTSKWQGRVITNAHRIVEIPARYGAGRYDVHVGLWDPDAGRIALEGQETDDRTYVLGTLIAQGAGPNVTNIRFEPIVRKNGPEPRWNAEKKTINFEMIKTSGALRLERQTDKVIITPLPELPTFGIVYKRGFSVATINAVNENGTVVRKVEFVRKGPELMFNTTAKEFAYELLTKEN